MSQDNQNSQPPSSPRPKANRSKPTATKETPNFLQRLQSLWSAALAKIRFLLPDSLSAKLSNTALTGIVAGIIVILVSINSSKGDRPIAPTEVANVPPQQVELPVTITTSTEAVPPSAPPTIEITPPVEETTPPSPEPEAIPTPTPTPTIILTPEQNLIAAIENQVAEVSDRFASGLIKSIQANFRSSSLTLKISDDWYTLNQSQQDKLCDKMLQRSKELDFSHVEILDSQDRLVARNPVVGDEMVVFRRLAS